MSIVVRASFLILALLLPTVLAACGPVRSTVVLIQADKALREARALGSAEIAPYPTEMSSQLIEKAKEEQGYSSYDTATVLAEDARTLARDALRLAKESGAAEEPAAEEPAAEEPAAEEPAAEEPAAEEPAAEEPAAEEPAAEEPAAEEPAAEEPRDDAKPTNDGEASP